MGPEWNFTDWAMTGLTALFAGGFVIGQRSIGKVESENRLAMSEIWQRIDKISENRVRREDVAALQSTLGDTLDELKIMRAQMVDMSNSVGYLRGRLERKGNDSNPG